MTLRSTRTLLLFAFIVGCSSESAREPAQTPPAPADAESDITPSPRRQPTPLPVASSDVVTLASAGLFMPGVTFGLDGGGLLAAAPRYDTGRIITVKSEDATSFAPARSLPGSGGDVTGTETRGDRAIYVMTSGGMDRIRIDGAGTASPRERVTLRGVPAGVAPYWPQAVGLPDGRILLAFVEAQKRAFVAVSNASGLTFDVSPAPTPEGELRGVLAHVGVCRDGAWVFTYQVADEQWLFRSFVRVSRNAGASWSAPLLVHETDPNVHDTYPVMRADDDGVDLYYLRANAAAPDRFSVHRRAWSKDGALGPEEVVTAPNVGHVEKPQPRRLPDGRIALAFAVRKTEAKYDLALAMLVGDAPAR